MLQDTSVKPGSSRVITKPQFVGPYIIKDVVVGRPDVGKAYRLVDENTGKALRHLVSSDRLKKFMLIDRILTLVCPAYRQALGYRCNLHRRSWDRDRDVHSRPDRSK